MTSNFPTTASEITAEWMTEALRGSGTIGPDTSVASVVLDTGAAGVGFMGEVGKVGVIYAGADTAAPTSMIAKFPTTSPEVRAMMHPTRIFEREHRFYAELATKSSLRTPAVYHVTCDTADVPDDERYMLLMEDLSSLDLGDQLAGCRSSRPSGRWSPRRAPRRVLGRRRTRRRRLRPDHQRPAQPGRASIYDASLPGFMEVFGEVILPELEGYVAGYAGVRGQILDDLEAMPHTLVHFDYRADNLMFDTDGSVAVVDWQTISQGGGAEDVGYLLSQNLSVADRRAHEADLLRAYHDTLVAHGVTDYSFEDLQADYQVGMRTAG